MGRQRVFWFGLDVVCRRTPLSGVGGGGGGHHYSITINIPTKFRTRERARIARGGSLIPRAVRGLREAAGGTSSTTPHCHATQSCEGGP